MVLVIQFMKNEYHLEYWARSNAGPAQSEVEIKK